MNDPINIFLLVISYFIILLIVSYITGKDDSDKNFFTGNRSSKWYIVAFGMVGTSLSGVTFISVPGWIQESNFTYLQVVIGYLFGYFVVALVLLPIYYRNNVTSIYEYLGKRFGQNSHKVGALFFFISRVLGASFRLFLVAIVLQEFIFKKWAVPFEITVVFSVFLIWVYTNRGGIKTIIWTDTFQTALMIGAVFLTISAISRNLEIDVFRFSEINEIKKYTKVFVFDSPLERNYFLKSIIGGFFITICMTGMDQDMMQKNLTCKNEKDAKKNMIVFSFILFIVTFLFMFLGALLYAYAEKENISVPLMDGNTNTDLLFPRIALDGGLGSGVAVTFILGLIAAAYSSADSALASLTTSFCIDFLNTQKLEAKIQKNIRKKVHFFMGLLIVLIVISFKYFLTKNVIDGLLTVAGYTYGPLLGLFAFGIFTKKRILDRWVWLTVSISVILTLIIGNLNSDYLGGYKVGYELLPINGMITFIGLILISRKQN